MGWGEWLFAARGLGCEIYGLELAPARITFAAANGVRVLRAEELSSCTFDIINCEQVLEHLDEIDVAMATIGRVLKPGGRAIIGVPIFPPPLHLARRHIVPRLDALLRRRRSRGHRQAFSLASFRRAMREHSGLMVRKARGFRVISGGLLRGLENYRWWWRANRRLGELAPALCIETQLIMEKPLDRGARPSA